MTTTSMHSVTSRPIGFHTCSISNRDHVIPLAPQLHPRILISQPYPPRRNLGTKRPTVSFHPFPELSSSIQWFQVWAVFIGSLGCREKVVLHRILEHLSPLDRKEWTYITVLSYQWYCPMIILFIQLFLPSVLTTEPTLHTFIYHDIACLLEVIRSSLLA